MTPGGDQSKLEILTSQQAHVVARFLSFMNEAWMNWYQFVPADNVWIDAYKNDWCSKDPGTPLSEIEFGDD